MRFRRPSHVVHAVIDASEVDIRGVATFYLAWLEPLKLSPLKRADKHLSIPNHAVNDVAKL